MDCSTLVHNGENIGNGKKQANRKKGDEPEQWQGALCYGQGNDNKGPPLLGDHPLPNFPMAWEPGEVSEFGEVAEFSSKNPFIDKHVGYREEATNKITEEMEKFSLKLEFEGKKTQADKFRKMASRIKVCNTMSVGTSEIGEIQTGPTGRPYLRGGDRCNSRFCGRCSKKVGRRGLERIFKRCGINPEEPPKGMRFLTLTMPGEAGKPLEVRYKRLRSALKKLYKSQIWQRRVEASIGKMEVTLNRGNWHVHAHFLLTGSYINNEALKTVWAECLEVDHMHINFPWVEMCKGGKNAFFEMAKYIAKPVSIIGRAKKTEKKTQQGIQENSEEWESDEMQQYFSVFASARIYTTTGLFKQTPGDKKEIKDEEDFSETGKEENQTLKEILTGDPLLYESAQNGHTESVRQLVDLAASAGYTKAQVMSEFVYLNVGMDLDQENANIEKWSESPQDLKKARYMQACHWERMRIYKNELRRVREELQTICEKSGAFY